MARYVHIPNRCVAVECSIHCVWVEQGHQGKLPTGQDHFAAADVDVSPIAQPKTESHKRLRVEQSPHGTQVKHNNCLLFASLLVYISEKWSTRAPRSIKTSCLPFRNCGPYLAVIQRSLTRCGYHIGQIILIACIMEGGMVSLRSSGPCTARALAGSLRKYARKTETRRSIRAKVKKRVADAAAQES
jgi:hypothetical protein